MAHVVECKLLAVDGHVYRVRESIGRKPVQHLYGEEEAEEDMDWQEEEQLEEDDADLIDDPLISQEGEAYVARVMVDPEVLPFVIGKGGSKLKEVEAATGASLHIPRMSQQRSAKQQHNTATPNVTTGLLGSSNSETITIKAPSKSAVNSARTRVELQIRSAISSKMLDYTHFISLPLSNEHTAAKLQEFQDKVLSDPRAHEMGFEPSIFINPKTLHLTLLMLKLYSDEDRHKAAQTLRDMQQQVQELLQGQPLTLQLSGLDHMSDDPTDMHVLYLKVVDLSGSQQRLQQLCDLVITRFKKAGLMLPGQFESVKLHCTVVNTRHRRHEQQQHNVQVDGAARSGRGGGRGGRGAGRGTAVPRIGLDGRQLLQQWGALDLGDYTVPAVHLSERGAYGANGYYACLAQCPL